MAVPAMPLHGRDARGTFLGRALLGATISLRRHCGLQDSARYTGSGIDRPMIRCPFTCREKL